MNQISTRQEPRRKDLCARCQAELFEERGYPPGLNYSKGIFVVGEEERHIGPIIADVFQVMWARRGMVVSTDTLLRLVWGATPPSARSAARNYIYGLRKIIAGSQYDIVSYPYRGWMLRVHESEMER